MGTLWFDDIGFRVVYTGRVKDDKQVLQVALPEDSAGFAASAQAEAKGRPRIIAGIVRDESGKQTDRSNIWIIPKLAWIVRDYERGTFEAAWLPSKPNTPMQGYHLIAYNKKRNLALGVEIDREVNTLDIQLKPGVILTGKVVDGDEGIQRATIFIYLRKSGWRPSSYMYAMRTDDEGKFEIRALPPGYDYILSFHSTGLRTVETEIRSADVLDNRKDGISIVLERGEFSISGVVVDTNGKPVPRMRVYCSAKGQPPVISHADANGKFTLDGVFKGQVKVIADGPKLFGSVDTEAGATNVRVVLDNKGRPPLKGRACFPGATGVWVDGVAVPISKVGLKREMSGMPGYIERIDEHEGAFECRDILLDSGNRISVVESHCFMLACGRWIAAQDLRAGQRLKTITGTVGIKSVTIRPTPYTGKV